MPKPYNGCARSMPACCTGPSRCSPEPGTCEAAPVVCYPCHMVPGERELPCRRQRACFAHPKGLLNSTQGYVEGGRGSPAYGQKQHQRKNGPFAKYSTSYSDSTGRILPTLKRTAPAI